MAEENVMRTFATGATRNNDTMALDYEGFLSPAVLESFAQYMHKHRFQADGNIRDSDNWQKGIPIESYMKSLLRHVFDVWNAHRGTGLEREDIITSLNACMFNVQGMQHELLKLKKEKE